MAQIRRDTLEAPNFGQAANHLEAPKEGDEPLLTFERNTNN